MSSRLYSIECPITMSIYGSVNSAYDSSRPGSHAIDDQVPIIIAASLTTVPTNWASAYSYDWAAATDPSYGGRLFYLVCNADYSAVPDGKNEAEKRQYTSLFVVTPQDFATNAVGEYSFNWVKFSFLDQDAEEETTAWIDPRIHHSLIIWIKYLTIAVENVEEEERVRARKELNR
eukprot:scaffold7907_cov163-Skeletonema_marinoi.AAC.9